MINLQLLSAVLGVEVISFELKQKNKIAYEYNKPSKNEWSGKEFCNRSINLYELANKCKEWAFDEGFEIHSFKRANNFYRAYPVNIGRGGSPIEISGMTEPESIFNACQYIYDNIKGNQS